MVGGGERGQWQRRGVGGQLHFAAGVGEDGRNGIVDRAAEGTGGVTDRLSAPRADLRARHAGDHLEEFKARGVVARSEHAQPPWVHG